MSRAQGDMELTSTTTCGNRQRRQGGDGGHEEVGEMEIGVSLLPTRTKDSNACTDQGPGDDDLGHGHVQGQGRHALSEAEPEGDADLKVKSDDVGLRFKCSTRLLAAVMGTVLEFYDFSVYAFFGVEIGRLFFPSGSPAMRAVQSFSVFASGFFMRPLGSVVLGAVGDRWGTAVALRWSIALMTLPTVAMGLLPTYSSVGILAPLLLTLVRLLQGLSVGGELVGAVLHTVDSPKFSRRRGMICGVVAACGTTGNLMGAVMATALHKTLTQEALMSWGWRVPFLCGSVLGLVGLFLRTRAQGTLMDEHTHAHARAHTTAPDAAGLSSSASSGSVSVSLYVCTVRSVLSSARWRAVMAKVILLAALNHCVYYTNLIWLGSYLCCLSGRPLDAASAFSVSSVLQCVYIVTAPLWGLACDVFAAREKGHGRLRFVLCGVAVSGLCAAPMFSMLAHGSLTLAYAYAGVAGLAVGFSLSGNVFAWISEVLHDCPARYAVFAVCYNIGAITGGLYPMLASALTEHQRVQVAPVLPSSALALPVFLALAHGLRSTRTGTVTATATGIAGGARHPASEQASDQSHCMRPCSSPQQTDLLLYG